MAIKILLDANFLSENRKITKVKKVADFLNVGIVIYQCSTDTLRVSIKMAIDAFDGAIMLNKTNSGTGSHVFFSLDVVDFTLAAVNSLRLYNPLTILGRAEVFRDDGTLSVFFLLAHYVLIITNFGWMSTTKIREGFQ